MFARLHRLFRGRLRRPPSVVAPPTTSATVIGHLDRYEQFPSAHAAPRTVDVWLPPGYHESGEAYRVVYLHDGQNLFDPALSFTGTPWGIDEALDRLTREEGLPPAIAVAVWNTPARIAEYMPQQPMERHATADTRARFADTYGGAPCSDAYLRFLATELKPWIDRTYRTLAGPEDTAIMGSSMGGLVSLYAFCAYPHVFGRAACLSTSWTVGGRVMLPYLKASIPDADGRRIYFDYGSEAQIATYESFQRRADRLFLDQGYVRGRSLLTRHYPGAPHSESAWRERVHIPLRFLLSDRAEAKRQAA